MQVGYPKEKRDNGVEAILEQKIAKNIPKSTENINAQI